MKIITNSDGGARGNPGPAAIGVVVWDEDRNRLEEYKEFLGKKTNNEAEYRGLVKALELAAEHTPDEVEVFMDSQLIIRQMQGEYSVNSENLIPLYERARSLASMFDKITFKHVKRDEKYQREADRLVNEALDNR